MNSKVMNERISQSKLIISIPGLNTGNILQISDFLPQGERDSLFDTVLTHQKAFQHINISETYKTDTLHLSLKHEASEGSEVVLIRQACEHLSKSIMELLPELFNTLGIEPFPVSHIPLSIINGFNGHEGMPHTDDGGGRFKISLLYYFSKTPKAFRGGALEFYETDATCESGHRDKAFAKVEHEDNQFIAFPSQTYHGVTKTWLNSVEFEDGRFVVLGFLQPA